MTWCVNFERSKDAQKQLAWKSLHGTWLQVKPRQIDEFYKKGYRKISVAYRKLAIHFGLWKSFKQKVVKTKLIFSTNQPPFSLYLAFCNLCK